MNAYSSFTHNRQKQARCPSTGEWINKLWYFIIMEQHLVIKMNELLTETKTWVNATRI